MLRSRLALLPAAAAACLALAGCGRGGATLATFAGTWEGHTRGLKITRAGEGTESIYAGCCHFGIAIHFQLSRPQGTSHAATATATSAAADPSLRRSAGSFERGRPALLGGPSSRS